MTFYNEASQRGDGYLIVGDEQGQDKYGFDYQTSSEYYNPLGYNPQSPSKPSDKVFPPPTRPATSYLASPLSSIRVSHDLSWNTFDQSFASAQTSIDNGAFVSLGDAQANGYPTGYTTSNSQCVAQPYVSLAAINETSTFNNVIEDEDSPRNTYETPPLASPATNYQPRKANWGSLRRRNSACLSSARPAPPSKRRKSWDKGSHSSHSRSESESVPCLRSTTQSSSQTPFSSSSSSSSSSAKSPSSKENIKGRTNHNQVEKEYRNRLNGQFQTLLSSLPNDDDMDSAISRVSKADVLVLAKKHIVQLEREKLMLQEQRQKLQGNVQELKRKYMEVEGICKP